MCAALSSSPASVGIAPSAANPCARSRSHASSPMKTVRAGADTVREPMCGSRTEAKAESGQGECKHLAHVVHGVNVHLLAHLFGDVVEVGLVVGGNDHIGEPGALRGEQLLLQA